MSQGPETTRHHTSEDEKILHGLGYAQELFRGMGGFRNFAISFTIISILAGCLTSYNIGFEHGGPMWVVFGWLLVGLMATIISLGMAEIASAYPTAGGLYYWASKLGSPGWGWATGWFNLIGQVAVTAAIGYGLALFGQALFDFWFSYTRAHERLVRRVVRCLDVHPVRDLPVRCGADQPAEHPPDVRAEHDLGVVAHGGRRCDRRDPDHRPERPPVALVRVHARPSTTRASATERPSSGSRSCSCSGWGCCSRSTRSPASTRRRTPPRRPTTRPGWRRWGCGRPLSSR